MLRLTRPALAGVAAAFALAACKGKTEQTAGGTVDTGMAKLGRGVDTLMSKLPGTTTWSNPVIIGYATTANSDEIMLGKLAVKKAKNGDVKAFARMMVTDHTKMLADTKQLGTKLSVTADTTEGAVRDLANSASSAEKELTDKPAGADWDKNYMDKMVAGHETVLDKLRDAAKTTDVEVRTALEGAITKVEAHLNKAKEVRAKLDTAT
jgi:putative membrane protein